MNDGMIFLGGLIFFFLLWLVGGGPSHPISFAGPFISPITNVNQTQSAYGPKVALGGTLSAGGNSVSVGERNAGPAAKIKNTSPYTGQVFLTHYVGGSSNTNTDPLKEYLGIGVSYGAAQGISISGWSVVSTITGVSAIIPQGVPMLKLGTVTLQPIVLQPGVTATIVSGPSPVNVSFEENTCTNYLSQQNNYSKCFAIHSNDSNFLTGGWRIYLNRSVRLWKNNNETIELLDNSGQVVDSFSY